MPIEIEAKMRLTDAQAMTKRLGELGATLDVDIVESNTYFDTNKGALKSSDRGLRIRIERLADGTQRANITHKGPRAHGKLKSRAEHEVGVDDARAAAELLTALGYRPTMTFEKRRCRYLLDDCRIELDTLPYLGDFIEIEGKTDEAVIAVREKLGLAETPLIKASYIAMLTTYAQEHNLSTAVINFETEPAGIV